MTIIPLILALLILISIFLLYKYVVNKYNLIGVCMGHHMGDITENVFTNIIKGKIGSDLGVMKKIDRQLDVDIYRPFLELIKDQIIKYAHDNNVPYFKNSTPSWSCRGVIRDQMIPILKRQFGDFEPNIIKTMTMWNKMYSLNLKYITKPVIKYKHGIKIPYDPDMSDEIFWDPILIDYLHSNGSSMISNKSKNIFIQWLKIVKNSRKTQCDLNSNFFAFFDNISDHIYIINYRNIQRIPNIKSYSHLDDLLDEIENSDQFRIKHIKNKSILPNKIRLLQKYD